VSRAGWAALAAFVFALYFGVQGGEYGTWDLMQLRRDEAEELDQVARLKRAVDSLQRAALAIEQDPKVQERVARELYGMIRKGEFLYKLVPGDSGKVRGER
jgi:cell division protein FtsB